ncbi:MAG: FHA domain-containing protein [Chloroflexi bacterium]|nr:FHA domain-containing protein [Chloroflexota bacterium]
MNVEMDAPAKILIRKGSRKNEMIRLEADRVSIGRAESNGIVLNLEQISRQHAEITRDQAGYSLTDLASRNGTWINGMRLKAHEPVRLELNDEIQLAGDLVLLQFVDAGTTLPAHRGLVLIPEKAQVRLAEKELQPPLSAQQFKLLHVLYEKESHVVSREAIVPRVWTREQADGITDEMIDALAARVRKRLRENDPDHDYIQTVRGQGFKFVQKP